MNWLKHGHHFSGPFMDADGGGAAGGGNGGGETPPAQGEQGGKESANPFDDFLKGKDNQAEFDRRVTKALETAKEKWQQDMDKQMADARSEAEKLAKMNEDEKARHEREKQDKVLADREAQITRRELRATALESLAEKGLPKGLADILNYTDAEGCNASLDTVEKAFRAAVQEGVDTRMRGKTPEAGGKASGDAAVRSAMGLPPTTTTR